MLLVDSHCHLNFPELLEDLEGVVARARAAGVGVMQTICTEMEEFEQIHAIAERFEGVYCSVGVHPNDSATKNHASVEELVATASNSKVIGIGETGLDYHYDHSPKEAQQESFRIHIRAARQAGLPLIVHTREAEEDTIRILREEMEQGPFTGVIHCFTSSQYLAEEAVKLGFYISASGIITFKNATAIRDALAQVPMDRLLIETDAPFLAPAPHRGKKNAPEFVFFVNKALAEIKAMDEAACARATTENFFRLFNRAQYPPKGGVA